MAADIVEIYWNARPHLERLGVNLRRRTGIDEKGQRLLEEVRKSLVAAFPRTPVLVRFAVQGTPSEADLRVIRPGIEQPHSVRGLLTAMVRAIRRTQLEAV